LIVLLPRPKMYSLHTTILFNVIILGTVLTAPMPKMYSIFDPLINTWKPCDTSDNIKEKITILDNKGIAIKTIDCPVDQSHSSRPVIIRDETTTETKHYEGRIGDQEIRALEVTDIKNMSITLPLG